MNLFRFIDAEKTHHPVRMMCRLLKVSPSGFYDGQGREPSPRELANTALTDTIRQIHKDSKKVCGSPRVHAELVLEHGMAVGKKRVAALMQTADLVGAHRRKRRGLTKQDKKAPPAPDLIGRGFTAVMPGIKMVGDITCLPTREGWLSLASVLDLCTRKLLGYAMAEHMRAELVVDAITMAATHSDLAGGAIFHSDRGSTPRSPTPNASPTSAPHPRSEPSATPTTLKALAETTNGLYYKTEYVYGPDTHGWDDVDELELELELATLSWVHWFNQTRLHGH